MLPVYSGLGLDKLHCKYFFLSFRCNLCGKGFSTNMSLKSHINVHEKGGNIQVKCELCPRVFTSRNRYEKHVKFKHPPRPEEYKCVECSKDFTTRRKLFLS